MKATKFFNDLEQNLLNPHRDLKNLSAEEQYNMIMSKVGQFPDSVVSKESLLHKLKESKKTGRPLKVKFGIDPTGAQIHLGHAVSLLNLKMFHDMGHEDVTPQLIRDMYKTMQIPSLGEDCDCIIVPINEKNKIIDFTDNITFQNYIQNIDRNLLTKTCKGDEYCI